MLQKFIPSVVSEQDIIAAIDSWMLSCAIGVSRGEWSRSCLTFDLWFECCKTTWVPEVSTKSGASTRQIKIALEHFVHDNQNKTSDMVLREVCGHRGEPVGMTLKPGESRTVAITAKIGETTGGPLTEDMICSQCGVICIGDGTLKNHNCEVGS
jgi:hypothetical protein